MWVKSILYGGLTRTNLYIIIAEELKTKGKPSPLYALPAKGELYMHETYRWIHVLMILFGLIGLSVSIKSCIVMQDTEYTTTGQVVVPTHMGVRNE